MEIRSTIYVHVDVLSRINDAAGRDREFRNRLIITLLKRVMQDHEKLAKNFRSVKYQDDDAPDRWKTLHVKFVGAENEYFHDMRKGFKMSVSLILAYAVKNYFVEVLNDLMHDNWMDNYPPKNYLIINEVVDDIVCWRIYWGFPSDQREIFRQ